MNFWNRHIGDIIRDTVSLTMLEDGAYTRLLDQYYQTERPLPLDRKMIYRLARATSAAERKACDFVMESFFQKEEDGYHQKRCDIEIASYQEKQRKAQASANARWSRTDSTANAYANASTTHDADDMRTHSEGNAHQAPVANNQTPNIKPLGETAPVEHPHERARPAEISAAMRKHGIEAQPADPRIIAASEAGYSVQTIDAACSEAKAAKPNERISPLYVLRIAERWTADAAKPRPVASAGRPGFTNARDESRKRAYEVLTGKTASQPEVQPAEVINGHVKLIG
jgi:uncharacterized protein YdaU (DUF1376 family)